MAVNEQNDSTQVNESKRDIDSAATEDWPQREFPINGRGQRNYVQVVIRRSVLNEIHEHGQIDTDVEVCGVLVGDGYRDERGPYLYVEHIIQGEHSDSKAAQVTFTAETWNHIQTTMDQEYPEKRIVGWYHTHPGFGIFLSDMDMFIHENFFGGDEQLALVYDPIGGDQGLFIWRDGKAVRDRLLVEEDAGYRDESSPKKSDHPAMTAGADQEIANGIEKRLAKLEKQQTIAFVALFFATILAIGWPIAASQLGLLEQSQAAPNEKPAENDRRQTQPPRNGALQSKPKQVNNAAPTNPPQKKLEDAQPKALSPSPGADRGSATENKSTVEPPATNQGGEESKSDTRTKSPQDDPGSRDAAQSQP